MKQKLSSKRKHTLKQGINILDPFICRISNFLLFNILAFNFEMPSKEKQMDLRIR
jgi:hypothetical protein